jgi:hypothetical protein
MRRALGDSEGPSVLVAPHKVLGSRERALRRVATRARRRDVKASAMSVVCAFGKMRATAG